MSILINERQSWSYGSSQLLVHSVPITTQPVISNPAHGDEYSTQHYVIKLVNDFGRSVDFPVWSGFLHQSNDRHDIAEILLKVELKP